MAQQSASELFLQKWLTLLECKKGKNMKSMSLAAYNENVADLQAARTTPGLKTSKQYNLMKNFILVTAINGEMKLAKKTARRRALSRGPMVKLKLVWVCGRKKMVVLVESVVFHLSSSS